jgi:hypothetical protein
MCRCGCIADVDVHIKGGKESRSTTIEEEILKIISELVMAGRISGIKTAADFFPEL